MRQNKSQKIIIGTSSAVLVAILGVSLVATFSYANTERQRMQAEKMMQREMAVSTLAAKQRPEEVTQPERKVVELPKEQNVQIPAQPVIIPEEPVELNIQIAYVDEAQQPISPSASQETQPAESIPAPEIKVAEAVIEETPVIIEEQAVLSVNDSVVDSEEIYEVIPEETEITDMTYEEDYSLDEESLLEGGYDIQEEVIAEQPAEEVPNAEIPVEESAEEIMIVPEENIGIDEEVFTDITYDTETPDTVQEIEIMPDEVQEIPEEIEVVPETPEDTTNVVEDIVENIPEAIPEAVPENIVVETVEEEPSEDNIDVTNTAEAVQETETSGSSIGQQAVDFASKWVGVTPYVGWENRIQDGVITNSLTNGTDCSGFVSLVYGELGISAPTGSDAYQDMSNTDYDNLEPGDVVVYRNGGHVGIYAGDDTIIHCSNEKDGTKISDMFYDEPTGYVHLSE